MRMKKALPAAAAVGIALAGTIAATPLVFAHDGGPAQLGGGAGMPRPDKAHFQAMIAEDLGISVEDFKARVQAGETPREIIASLGITPEQMHEKMQARAKAAIEERVASGKLTREQADKILERMANHPKPAMKLRRFIKHRAGQDHPRFERVVEQQ